MGAMTLRIQTAAARRAVIQRAWARPRTLVTRAGTGIRSEPTSQPSRSSAVQVEGGVFGWGEAGLSGRELAVAGAVDHYAQFLVGQVRR